MDETPGSGPQTGSQSEGPTPEPYETVALVRWDGPWPEDDPDADYKRHVAEHRLVNPMDTVRGLAEALDIPVGALVQHILARWATSGSSALMELGSETVIHMRRIITEAETEGTDGARLEAYRALRGLVSWLAHPLDHPEVYDPPNRPSTATD